MCPLRLSAEEINHVEVIAETSLSEYHEAVGATRRLPGHPRRRPTYTSVEEAPYRPEELHS
jgi:hypothetical protein